MSPRKLHAPDFCSFRIEEEHSNSSLVGVDEVGRGCIAGPVVVAAVSFCRSLWQSKAPEFQEIRDSKLLSEKRREYLHDFILEHAEVAESLAISPAEVDRLNILQATLSGFRQLVSKIHSEKKALDLILVDGNQSIPHLSIPQRCIIQGDRFSKSIAAASIIAKVRRDRLMKEMAKNFPNYGFEKHKGYGTKAHWAAINELGPCSLHRQSFLGRALKVKVGKLAESAVARYLRSEGFEIIQRNWRCKVGEIDIIARREKQIHFIEVRKRNSLDLERAFPVSKQLQFKKLIEIYGQRPEARAAEKIRSHFICVVGAKVFPQWDVFKL